MQGQSTAIYTECCSSVAPTGRHHEIATGAAGSAALLAGSSGREENRLLQNNKTGGDPMQSNAQIDQVLHQKSDAKDIPGVVAIAANSQEVVYQGAFGKRDLSKDAAMTPDSVFWIASMSKAITAAAGMHLVEQGKLSLDAPIGKVLPDLASPQVLEGFGADGTPKLRPAKNPITLRHLMTHTAGFAYDMWNGDMVKYLENTGTPGVITCKSDALKTPLMTDPGTRWEYGTNIDFVGKAVEAVSGKRYRL
jgi:CubicO group peptidase (beta-lactamase class C family)